MPSEEERKQIREQQDNRCFYCHEPLQDDGDNPATLDHFIPRSLLRVIQEHITDNFVYACWDCNQKKGDKTPRDWDGRAGDWQLTQSGWRWVGDEVEKELPLKAGKELLEDLYRELLK